MDSTTLAALSTVTGHTLTQAALDLRQCRKEYGELEKKARRGHMPVGYQSVTWKQFTSMLIEEERRLLDAIELAVHGPGTPEERIEHLRDFLQR
jgi:hypothetical protein